MGERPRLFSAPMVRAMLANRKTETRRLLSPQNVRFLGSDGRSFAPSKALLADAQKEILDFHRRGPADAPVWIWKGPAYSYQPGPYTNWHCFTVDHVGDRLWVREACADEHPLAIQDGRYSQEGRAGIPGPPPVAYRTIYRADGEPLQIWHTKDQKHPYWTLEGPADEVDARHPTICSNYARGGKGIYWTPSIHMPRCASRLTLEVTCVLLERLHEITDSGAEAEGMYPTVLSIGGRNLRRWFNGLDDGAAYTSPRAAYEALWCHLHGANSWSANPLVIVTAFAVHLCNIDKMEPAP